MTDAALADDVVSEVEVRNGVVEGHVYRPRDPLRPLRVSIALDGTEFCNMLALDVLDVRELGDHPSRKEVDRNRSGSFHLPAKFRYPVPSYAPRDRAFQLTVSADGVRIFDKSVQLGAAADRGLAKGRRLALHGKIGAAGVEGDEVIVTGFVATSRKDKPRAGSDAPSPSNFNINVLFTDWRESRRSAAGNWGRHALC